MLEGWDGAACPGQDRGGRRAAAWARRAGNEVPAMCDRGRRLRRGIVTLVSVIAVSVCAGGAGPNLGPPGAEQGPSVTSTPATPDLRGDATEVGGGGARDEPAQPNGQPAPPSETSVPGGGATSSAGAGPVNPNSQGERPPVISVSPRAPTTAPQTTTTPTQSTPSTPNKSTS